MEQGSAHEVGSHAPSRRRHGSWWCVGLGVRVLGFRGEGDRAAEPVENQRGEAPVGTEGRVERSPWLGL